MSYHLRDVDNYKKNTYNFARSSKEKRNISPYLNKQNYSFSNQNNNQKLYNNHNKFQNNYDNLDNPRSENPLVYTINEYIQKRKKRFLSYF